MEIKGFVKNSFVDWDGKIVSTIFLPGCNFQCGFCHNKAMVKEHDSIIAIPFSEVESHLRNNKNFIDGVVVTGGEPTIHQDLPKLLGDIKSLGFPVKLDTNGSNPKEISFIFRENLVDYIAMDIKGPLDEYDEITGSKGLSEKIKESIEIIMKSGIDYEFRTTIVPIIHDESEMEKMASMIGGARLYVLQKFIPKNNILEDFEKTASPTREQLEKLAEIARKHVKRVLIRD